MNFTEYIESEVTKWGNVTAAPHKYGGREFLFNGKEFGHIHPNGMLDILFNKQIRETLINFNLAEQHHFLPETGWISFYTNNQFTTSEKALSLLWLNYVLINKRKQNNFDANSLLKQQPFAYPQQLITFI